MSSPLKPPPAYPPRRISSGKSLKLWQKILLLAGGALIGAAVYLLTTQSRAGTPSGAQDTQALLQDSTPPTSGALILNASEEEWRKGGGITVSVFMPNNSPEAKLVRDSIETLQALPNWNPMVKITFSDTSSARAPFAAKTGASWPVIYISRPDRQSHIRGLDYLSVLPVMLMDRTKPAAPVSGRATPGAN